MQGSNYTQELKDAGLRSPQELRKVFEFNPMGGGRIIRDKLWFYMTYRSLSAENTVPGMFFNRNAGDPTKWVVDFDTGRLAYNDNIDWSAIGRITWQISPRNKFSLSHSQQYSRRNAEGGGQATRTPEAVGLTLYTPGLIQTATWASPFTNRLLFEAGWADYFAKYANSAPRIDGSNPIRLSRSWNSARTQRCVRNSVGSLTSSIASTRSNRGSRTIRLARSRRCGRPHRIFLARIA